jgi:pullulanase/glycogen debranching enzyme
VDDDFLVLFHGAGEPMTFRLAAVESERPWLLVLDTADEREARETHKFQYVGPEIEAQGRSVLVLSRSLES